MQSSHSWICIEHMAERMSWMRSEQMYFLVLTPLRVYTRLKSSRWALLKKPSLQTFQSVFLALAGHLRLQNRRLLASNTEHALIYSINSCRLQNKPELILPESVRSLTLLLVEEILDLQNLLPIQ